MPVLDFAHTYHRRQSLTSMSEFDEEGNPLWIIANNNGPLRIKDMDDQHLLNSISFAKRKFREWQGDTLRDMHQRALVLQGEMADFYMSRDIADVEETRPEEWCPRLRYLELEAEKRGIRK